MPELIRAHYLSDHTASPLTVGSVGSGARLYNVIIGTGISGATVTITDVATGNTVATIDASTVTGPHDFKGAFFKDGFTVTLGTANALVTVLTD